MSHTLLILKIYTFFKMFKWCWNKFLVISTGFRFSKLQWGSVPSIPEAYPCLKHNSMNVYINWIIFRQFWVHSLSKRVKKLIILQHFFSNLLSKITSLKCNTTLLYKKAKMLIGPYFHEKTWSAASYCSLKVTKPPESFKIEAKYAKVCFLWQHLIPSLLRGSQVS